MKHNWAFWLCTVFFTNNESEAFLSYCSILNDLNYIGDLRALHSNSHFAAEHHVVTTLFAETVYWFLTPFVSSNTFGRSEPFLLLSYKNNTLLITFMNAFKMTEIYNTYNYFTWCPQEMWLILQITRRDCWQKAPIQDFKRTYGKYFGKHCKLNMYLCGNKKVSNMCSYNSINKMKKNSIINFVFGCVHLWEI